MITFKQFLAEGGAATAKFNTQRATKEDIEAALKFVSKTLGISYNNLKADLLGSTELTLLGKKKDSGDIDLAMSTSDATPEVVDEAMKDAGVEGAYNPGTKVGSYAVPVGGDKKVQFDFMYVKNKDWAKFIYHSEQGNGSEYQGAVRNIILLTALAHTQEPGKDFVLRDETGKAVVRASKSITMSDGMKRLFKMAKVNAKTGAYGKTVDTVSPQEIEDHLRAIGKNIKFSHDPETTDTPDHIAEFIFGAGVKAKDIMSAENVIAQIKKLKNSAQIIAACKSELNRLKLPVPKEL